MFECKLGTVGFRKMYVSKVLALIAGVPEFGSLEFTLKNQRRGNRPWHYKELKRNNRTERDKLGRG